ncbi:MAG: hypothetical protein D6826_04135, partial [Alphaproteobacteria bacterium]
MRQFHISGIAPMPELPDVEYFRCILERHGLRRTIADVVVADPRIVDGSTVKTLQGALCGTRLSTARRHGKHLFARIAGDGWLTMHFGMTGALVPVVKAAPAPRFERLRLDFKNATALAFVDPRRLGRVGLSARIEDFIAAHGLGPDALDPDLTAAGFAERVSARRGGIKAILMNQEVVAGVGNIYADEILFQARIHPATPRQALDAARLAHLYRAMREVLETAIA